MIRKSLLFLSLIILSYVSYSQESNAQMILTDSLKSCNEIQYACMQLIPLYYQDGRVDTAEILLKYWENHCGTDETIYRTKVLWAIDSGSFSDTLIDEYTISYLDLYQWFRNDTTGNSLYSYYYYTSEFELLKWYQSFTDSIAKRASGYLDLSSEERFFVNFYLDPSDSSYQAIQLNELRNTKIAKIYNQPVGGELPEGLLHYGFSAGMWIPDDKLITLGMHPSIGVNAGMRYHRMIYNIGAAFRIGGSPNEYEVVYKDSLYTTDKFLGINFSLEAGRQVISWRRHELDILGGLDLEVMNVLTLKNDLNNADDNESKAITSPSMHLGAGYRYYLNNERYIGLSSRYHLLNFKNKGGTNLRGNALTITLEYGFGAVPWLNKKQTFLKQRLPAN
jgi:hypothetical protein